MLTVGDTDGCNAKPENVAACLGYVVVNGREALSAARREGLAAVNRGRREVVRQKNANEARRRAAGALAAEIERVRLLARRAGARLQRRGARFRAYLGLAE